MLFYPYLLPIWEQRDLQHFHLDIYSFSVSAKNKQWAKPATQSLISGVLSDLTRSRSDLLVENALLRQQLIVLIRQVKRPQLTQNDP